METTTEMPAISLADIQKNFAADGGLSESARKTLRTDKPMRVEITEAKIMKDKNGVYQVQERVSPVTQTGAILTKLSASNMWTLPNCVSSLMPDAKRHEKEADDNWLTNAYKRMRAACPDKVRQRAQWSPESKTFTLSDGSVTSAGKERKEHDDDIMANDVFPLLHAAVTSGGRSLVGQRYWAQMKPSKDGKYTNVRYVRVEEPTDGVTGTKLSDFVASDAGGDETIPF